MTVPETAPNPAVACANAPAAHANNKVDKTANFFIQFPPATPKDELPGNLLATG
jgi:hypothetical protein